MICWVSLRYTQSTDRNSKELEMKKIITISAAVTMLSLATLAQAVGSHHVDGYFRKNGTYVPPHYTTNPDGTRENNWSHQGNVNPYTGKEGNKD
jgi:hypothetical protein